MKHDIIDRGDMTHEPCTYGTSRTKFRGPKRSLTDPYLTFIGGTETYGKFMAKPFPALIEEHLDRTCINLGCVNGGVDAFVNDSSLMGICSTAEMNVVQIVGANYLSNRFYTVHPRRNDRFLCASSELQAIYPDVDFSQFTFARHMLNTLYEKSPERFGLVVKETCGAWVARMQNMLNQIGDRAILLWFSQEELSDKLWSDRPDPLRADPLFVTATMVDALRHLVRDVVIVNPSQRAQAVGTDGMHFPDSETRAATELLGTRAHDEVSAALLPVLHKHMSSF